MKCIRCRTSYLTVDPYTRLCRECEKVDLLREKINNVKRGDCIPVSKEEQKMLKEAVRCVKEDEPTMWENRELALAYKAAKPQIGLIPPTAIRQEARAMEDGKKKYGVASWREQDVVAALQLTNACRRHILDWLEGEECAPDTGVHHLAHARADLGILLDAQEAGTLDDDRVGPVYHTPKEG